MANRIAASEGHAEERNGDRRRYSAPSILSRERLESAANVCSGYGTKSNQGQPNPYGNPSDVQDFCGAVKLSS